MVTQMRSACAYIILTAVLISSALLLPTGQGTTQTESIQPATCIGNGDCPSGEYCGKAAGDCQGVGTCQTKPIFCPDIWDPVCGCDANTYSNSCLAAMAGVTVDYDGECIATCIDNGTCSQEEYCHKNIGDCDGTGTCVEKPEVCMPVWDPVCGCNGVTYSNACYAALAGVNVQYDGECPSTCSTNGDCTGEEYCNKIVGDCDGEGACTARPLQCADVWAPVCGCDKMTYGNECFAAAAGVSIDYDGECVPTCSTNSDCSGSYYCEKSVGDCSGEGTCTVKPLQCADIWNPVCGCDGMTYGNDCFAASAGVSIAYEGECVDVPCTINGECGGDEFCSKETGDCEGEGTCQPKPDICPRVWDPVCGCDGTTYSNACYAAMAGVNVSYEGECAMPCSTNEECTQDDYCAKADGDCDGKGTCQEKPTACPDVWDPVCGCDGNTYGNSCEAAASGINVDYEGGCTAQFQRGDANRDGNINVLDMLAVANHILDIAPLDSLGQYLADCNGDDTINVLDMLAIANVILDIFTECPDNGCRPVVNGEVMKLLFTLESYLTSVDYARIMDLVKEASLPTEFYLGQNYPNPFNAQTAISYQLSAISEQTTDHSLLVTLKVYNLLGQEVATLVDGVQEAGYYTVTWDGSDVASGVYFYRLTAGPYTGIRRMVFLQ